MQVRAIEFQENFARVPVEGARQQSILQREPERAQQQLSQAGAAEQVLNLGRPRPTTETENAIVDQNQERPTEGGSRGTRRQLDSNEPSEQDQRGQNSTLSGNRFDVVV